MRPDWDDYFFQVAAVVATRATCPRASIGAVLVRQKRVIGTGYNGVAEGAEHCPDTPEHLVLDHCRQAIHAERNALANALVPAFGATLYVVGPRPICPSCREALALCGVTDIRWQPSVLTLESVLAESIRWAAETFAHQTATSKIEHLRREAIELSEAPASETEWADILILLAGIAHLRGVSLAAIVARKLAVLRIRTWGQPDLQGVVEHIRVPANDEAR